MLAIKLLFVIFLPYYVNGQIVSNVRLVDHFSYFVNIMQETMYEVERRGWCNLKVPTITNEIDSDIYGWHVTGQANYTNGFVKAIGMNNLIDSTIQQMWSHSAETNTSKATVHGSLSMNEVEIGFDVHAELDGEKHFFTGVFPYTLIQFHFYIEKNLQTGEITTSTQNISISPGSSRRMAFLPENKFTQILSRAFVANRASDGIDNWGSDIFNPILQDVARTKIQFPEICYHCSIV